jgi:hypothetical protein
VWVGLIRNGCTYCTFVQHALYAIFLPMVCRHHIMLFVLRVLLVIVVYHLTMHLSLLLAQNIILF